MPRPRPPAPQTRDDDARVEPIEPIREVLRDAQTDQLEDHLERERQRHERVRRHNREA